MPFLPQASLSEELMSPADAPTDSLFTSESFSPPLPSALKAAEHLLYLFGLTSALCSSVDDESLPPPPFVSSLSSDP
jgi:hypothetical protein